MNKKKQIVIIGAGGQGRVVADIAKLVGYERIIFLDDTPMQGVTGPVLCVGQYLQDADVFVAIGNSAVREKIQNRLEQDGASVATLVHPNAIVAETASIGKGTAVMAGAVISPFAVVGKGVIVNTCASVDHDCLVEDFVHIAVGAHVCGTTKIGRHTWIGAGATVIEQITICPNCIVGAGAVVVKDIIETGTYVGLPARRLEH